MSETKPSAIFDIELSGCRPEPLASYLKALGVLRLVAEQVDKNAAGFWQGDRFVLRSSLDRDALERFFVEKWCPTPVVSPWNGGGGFTQPDDVESDKDSEAPSALEEIGHSKNERLQKYREVIEAILTWPELPPGDLSIAEIDKRIENYVAALTDKERSGKDVLEVLARLAQFRKGVREHAVPMDVRVSDLERKNKDFNRLARKLLTKIRGWSRGASKSVLLAKSRSELPDAAVDWVDATWALSETSKTTPLLGTGGNDGNLDFSANFMERVLAVLGNPDGQWIRSSVFAEPMAVRFDGKLGQYDPAAGRHTNPWDFVLLVEGALMFSAAATRRYESASPFMMAFPFHARASGGSASLADSDEDETRDELWLPLWSAPTTYREIRRLFSEGRATVGTGDAARSASSALDFARALAALGVDRGVESFARVGFHMRNGRAYFATPLGRFATREVGEVRLLDDIDHWFDRFRQKATGKTAPARVALARRRLEQTMFDAVAAGGMGPVLLELAATEFALAQSLAFAEKAFLRPVPKLRAEWLAAVEDGSVEQRLAAALATRIGMRSRLISLDERGRDFGRSDDSRVVFTDRPLVDNLHALLLREEIEAQQQQRSVPVLSTHSPCSLADIASFIDGDVDDGLLERWMRAFVLVDGRLSAKPPYNPRLPPASFAILALAHARRVGDAELPRTAAVLSRACAGDAEGATRPAIRRLNASGRPLPIPALIEPRNRTRRIAAALAFPLSDRQRQTLESMVLPAVHEEKQNEPLSQEPTV